MRGYETLPHRHIRVYLDDGMKPLNRNIYRRFQDGTYWVNFEKMMRQVARLNGVYHLDLRKDKQHGSLG